VSDLAEAQREMDEAAKKAREDARKRNGKGAEKGKPTEAAAPEPQPRTGPAAPTGPTPLSLFDQADGAENPGDSAASQQQQQQEGRP